MSWFYVTGYFGGGAPGTGSVGGAPGIGCNFASAIGTVGVNGTTLGAGGNGGDGPYICSAAPGGGGGGGYVGGGGGGSGSAGTNSCNLNTTGGGAGGAGGTNYLIPAATNTVESNGVSTGNGTVIISYSVSPSTPISVNSGTICNGSSFTINPSGASTYSIQGGSAVVTPTTTTTYTVVGYMASGCTSLNTPTVTVVVDAVPSVSVNSGSICAGESFTINPTGAVSYTIQGANAVVSPLASTIYTVIGAGAGGCVSANTASSSVTVKASPAITVNSGSVCSGSVFTVVPVGAMSYTFSTGSSTIAPTSNTTVSVSGTGTNGCVSAVSATSSINVIALPTIAVNSGIICNGEVFTITPSGASTYTFSNGSSTLSPTTNTTINVTGTSSVGCLSSNTAVASITVNANPVISLSNATVCTGKTTTLVASGAATYTWSNLINGSTNAVSPSVTTTYTLIGTSAQGCTASASATVSVNQSPTVTIGNFSICSGSSLALNPSGASTYTFSNGSATLTPLTNTTISITGTGTNGCVSSNTAISSITADPAPTITVNSGTSCSGNSFVINPAGATTYTISGGTATVSPSSNTSYSVTGTGTNGCVSPSAAIASVTVNSKPTITVVSSNTLLCVNESATLTAGGASLYAWDTNATTAVIVITPPQQLRLLSQERLQRAAQT